MCWSTYCFVISIMLAACLCSTFTNTTFRIFICTSMYCMFLCICFQLVFDYQKIISYQVSLEYIIQSYRYYCLFFFFLSFSLCSLTQPWHKVPFIMGVHTSCLASQEGIESLPSSVVVHLDFNKVAPPMEVLLPGESGPMLKRWVGCSFFVY